jgi:hypothetical protein
MATIDLTGTITAGAQSAGIDVFPGASARIPLGFYGGQSKAFMVGGCVLTRIINSPAAFVTLSGVGASDVVTQGSFLYLKSDGVMILELTTDDGAGSTEVVELPVQGLVVIEFPTNRPLEALRIKGSGKIEYLVAGQS